MSRYALQQNKRRGFAERKSRGEDDAGDTERDSWVEVESPGAMAAVRWKKSGTSTQEVSRNPELFQLQKLKIVGTKLLTAK